MVKEKRILSYFVGWLVLGFIVCFLGITKTYAAEQKTGLGFLNNSSVYISNKKGADIQLTRQTANNVNMDIKSIVFISNYNFQANTVYDYEIQITGQYLRNIDKASILSNNGICTLIGLSGLGEEYTKVRFTCSTATSSITIGLSNLNDNNITNGYNINWQSIYLWSITDTIDLGPIINNQSQNTQDILNNDNQNTNNIIENNNQNTQDIIDSNKETQNVIKDQFNSCRPSLNLFDKNNLIIGFINNNTGEIITGGDSSVTSNMINLKSDIYTISGANLSKICFYDDDLSFIKCDAIGKYQYTFNIDQYKNIRLQFLTSSINNIMLNQGNTAKTYEEFGEICTNKLDEQNDKLNSINGALTDSSPTDMSVLGDTAGWLPPGPVDSIINLPLTFFLNLSQSLSSECRPVSLPLPYVNKNIELPCMYSIYEKIGITGIGGFLTWVGLICSAVMLFNYLLDLYHWVDRTLTMRENTMPGYYEDKWGGGA